MKRIISFFLVLSLIISCGATTSASEEPTTRASLALSGYLAVLLKGTGNKVIVSYQVNATMIATSLGVKNIWFFDSDGNPVDDVTGSIENGLIRTNSNIHAGDFEYPLPAGGSYYAKVNVFAGDEYNYSSRIVTTSTVTIP